MMSDVHMFLDKELSWLSFNERVLQEAQDPSVPVITRIRFLGIFASNLDEFFRVRVADIRRRALLNEAQYKLAGNDDLDSFENEATILHSQIISTVASLTQSFNECAQQCFELLEQNNIHTLFNNQGKNINPLTKALSERQKQWLETYFDNRILRHITPIIVQSKTQLASCIDDQRIYFLVSLNNQQQSQYALVEIPRDKEDRFIVLPALCERDKQTIVMLDDVVHYFIDKIFTGIIGYDHIEAYSIKLTRDAEYNLSDDLEESLLDQMSKSIKQRLKADLVRLVYDQHMPDFMTTFLRKTLKIKELDNLVAGGRYRHFEDFIGFPNLGESRLENQTFNALSCARFTSFPTVFEAISQNDILLYYPYHKFNHFTEFVRQASYDPYVTEIKINIYRVAKHSRIISALSEAVKNGKRVTVVVELRARFDEQANIAWAKVMKDAGIDVEIGIETLKIHAKMCLVTRTENDKTVRYAHIGTGNFHENNARIYTDFSLFTKQKELTLEVSNVFQFISHSYKRFRFNHLIVSPLTSRRRLYQLIENEISQAEKGKKAEIILKLNNLVDKGLISKLYKASNAGVKIKMIVRGMCSLIPGLKGQSENIKIISIVDQFLEHPRVMVFHSSGEQQVFITSADWMERNLDHRVEVATPIYDPILKDRILTILAMHFKDNVKARIINQQNDNKYVKAKKNAEPFRSQIEIYHYLLKQEATDKAKIMETLALQPSTNPE